MKKKEILERILLGELSPDDFEEEEVAPEPEQDNVISFLGNLLFSEEEPFTGSIDRIEDGKADGEMIYVIEKDDPEGEFVSLSSLEYSTEPFLLCEGDIVEVSDKVIRRKESATKQAKERVIALQNDIFK